MVELLSKKVLGVKPNSSPFLSKTWVCSHSPKHAIRLIVDTTVSYTLIRHRARISVCMCLCAEGQHKHDRTLSNYFKVHINLDAEVQIASIWQSNPWHFCHDTPRGILLYRLFSQRFLNIGVDPVRTELNPVGVLVSQTLHETTHAWRHEFCFTETNITALLSAPDSVHTQWRIFLNDIQGLFLL